ncbi:DedA family protein [Plantactinospora siamensis]|uniref:DedA family protein n=1 Tax=Plantactinospora siamensis TaxID=555372 RepID=A0ABV6NXM4_9ACTN
MNFTTALLNRIAELPPAGIYAAAAAVLAGEVGLLFGLVLPAASTMLTVGLLARTGQLDLGTAALVCTLAAFAGDQLGFLEGRLTGARVRAGWLGRRVGDRRWGQAEELIRRRGGPAVTVGRWTAFARTLVPRVAGAVGLPYRRFVAFDALGVLVWVPGTVGAGYLAGASVSRLPGLVALAVAAAVVLVVLARRLRAAATARRLRAAATARRATAR